MLLPLLSAAGAGYLLGALPFGWYIARRHGVNIFEHGSKNPGATNVKRVLGELFGARGKRAGNLVFALDALKGAAAAGWPLAIYGVMHRRLSERGVVSINEGFDLQVWHVAAVVGLFAALLGHSFSCFTRFKGGKGVATAAGGFAVLAPLALLGGLATWIVAFYATRYVSLASILAGAAIPLVAWLTGAAPVIVVLGLIVAVLVAVRHRTNIARLLAGTEHKFTKKPTASA